MTTGLPKFHYLPLTAGGIGGRSLHQIQEGAGLHITGEMRNRQEVIEDASRRCREVVEEDERDARL